MKVIGGPVAGAASWKALSTRDACFAGVLGHLLAGYGAPADVELLAALRTHPNPLVT